jgi:dihydroorotase
MKTLKIHRPSDFHTHLRSPAQVGEKFFRFLVRMNCAHYSYVVVEPNTFLDNGDPTHHIETVDDLLQYQGLVTRVLAQSENPCEPLFLTKLTPKTTPNMIRDAADAGCIGLKLYPEGVTTGSSHGGVSDFFSRRILKCLEYAQERDLAFQIHPEMPKNFCLEREHLFHDVLTQYAKNFQKLRIFVEHVTDRRTLHLIQELRQDQSARVFGTITGHHLNITLDNVLGNVDNHCWPCAKYPEDRDELVSWSTRAVGYMISITDSAPHKFRTKHLVECACAGVFNPAEIAIPWLVTLFERKRKGILGNLNDFASRNGLMAYKLAQLVDNKLTLVRKSWEVPKRYDSGAGMVTPFLAGKVLPWQIVS